MDVLGGFERDGAPVQLRRIAIAPLRALDPLVVDDRKLEVGADRGVRRARPLDQIEAQTVLAATLAWKLDDRAVVGEAKGVLPRVAEIHLAGIAVQARIALVVDDAERRFAADINGPAVGAESQVGYGVARDRTVLARVHIRSRRTPQAPQASTVSIAIASAPGEAAS